MDLVQGGGRWTGGQCSVYTLNPLRAADFSAHPSRATEEFSQNN